MKSLRRKLEGKYTERPCIYPELGNCHIWRDYSDTTKYGRVSICKHPVQAHRVSWMVANGPIPPGKFICHHCDTPACINPDHLYAGDAGTNRQDAERRNRVNVPRGESHPNTRLKDNDIREIRKLAAMGEHHQDIAIKFDVGVDSIRSIVRCTSWKHVTSDYDLYHLNLSQRTMLLKWRRENKTFPETQSLCLSLLTAETNPEY